MRAIESIPLAELKIRFNDQVVNWSNYSDFIFSCRAHSRKPDAASSDKSRFKMIVSWFNDKEWSKEEVRNFFTYLDSKQLSNGTINRYRSALKNLDLIFDTNFVRLIRHRTEYPITDRVPLSADEILKLASLKINYGKHQDFINRRQETMIWLMGVTGRRAGDITKLCWEQIIDGIEKQVHFLKTKNRKHHCVTITDNVYARIMSLPRISKYVFPSPRGKALSISDINNDLEKRVKAVGLNRHVTSHMFRHSIVRSLEEQGASDSDICAIAGWSDNRQLFRYKNLGLVTISA